MRKYKWEKRELVDAVLYLVDSGCKWRQLPHDFPPPFTVHSFYRRARLSGLWDKIWEHMEKVTRKNAGLVRQLHSSILKVFRTPKLVNNPDFMQEKKERNKETNSHRQNRECSHTRQIEMIQKQVFGQRHLRFLSIRR